VFVEEIMDLAWPRAGITANFLGRLAAQQERDRAMCNAENLARFYSKVYGPVVGPQIADGSLPLTAAPMTATEVRYLIQKFWEKQRG